MEPDENTNRPTFPHYEGVPILADQKQQSPLVKITMKMLQKMHKPKVQIQKPFKTTTRKAPKKVKFY